MGSGLIDMARTDAEKSEQMPLVQDEKYPYGLRITLNSSELEKLDVDHSDWAVGETFHIHALAKVVSKSANETEGGGENCCIQLQLTHMAGESEDAEDESDGEMYHADNDTKPHLEKHGYHNGSY